MKLTTALAAALFVCGSAVAAEAQVPAAPTATSTGETGLFDLVTGDTLPRGGWSFGFYYNNWDRLVDLEDSVFPGADDIELDWNRLSTSAGFGITDRWEITAQFPFFDDLTYRHDQTLVGRALDSSGMNNIRVGANYQVFRDPSVDYVVSVSGHVELPTGNEDVANGDPGFGFRVAGRMRQVVYNFGYRDPGDDDGYDNPQQVLAGIGYTHGINERVQWVSEFLGTLLTGGEPDVVNFRNALDLTTGVHLSRGIDSRWAAKLALRLNVNGLSGVGGLGAITYRTR